MFLGPVKETGKFLFKDARGDFLKGTSGQEKLTKLSLRLPGGLWPPCFWKVPVRGSVFVEHTGRLVRLLGDCRSLPRM